VPRQSGDGSAERESSCQPCYHVLAGGVKNETDEALGVGDDFPERQPNDNNAPRDAKVVVRLNRPRIFLVATFLLLVWIIASGDVFGFPPVEGWRPDQIIGLIILVPFGLIAIAGVIGAFSPPPLLTISSEGIRRHSGFGLFGTHMMPWSEIKAIVVD
jgi:hypothetical protein